MSLLTILIVVLILSIVFGGVGVRSGWGYVGWSPTAIILLVLLVLWLAGGFR